MSAPLVDGHGHVLAGWLQQDAADLRAMLRRCARHGVQAWVVSLDLSPGRPEHDLPRLREVFAACGVRLAVTLGFEPPSDRVALQTWEGRLEQALAAAAGLARDPAVVGIGEVGLDHYWPAELLGRDLPPGGGPAELAGELRACHEVQARVFARFIALAGELDLPLVVHEREAHAEARRLLDAGALPARRVVFHCYGGTPAQAREDAAAGYRLSIPSSAAFRDPYGEVAAAVPLPSLLVETDTPYHSPWPGMWKRCLAEAEQHLAAQGLSGRAREEAAQAERARRFFAAVERDYPGLSYEPHEADGGVAAGPVPAAAVLRRGKARYRNDPVFVRSAARAVAEARGEPLADVCAQLRQNASDLFGVG